MTIIPAYNREHSNSRDLHFREIVGSMMYIGVTTRPDIMFTVYCLARFMSCYRTKHWKAERRVAMYLRSNSKVGMTYGAGMDVVGNVDSDWAEDTSTKISTNGYVFICRNATFSWKIELQTVVKTSYNEAK